jgi:hypothetical protein
MHRKDRRRDSEHVSFDFLGHADIGMTSGSPSGPGRHTRRRTRTLVPSFRR